MKQKAAIVSDDNVVNVVVYDPDVEWTPPEGFELHPLTEDDSFVSPGWARKPNGDWEDRRPEPPELPEVVPDNPADPQGPNP